jgi:hypothetical protein
MHRKGHRTLRLFCAEALDNEELNVVIANAKTALGSGNLVEIIPVINAIGEPFIAATKGFVAKL